MADAITFIGPGWEWPILLAADHPIARLAAEELQSYLLRISKRRVPIVRTSETGLPCIELLWEERASDGFVRQVSPQGIRLLGRSPRGLLCGVYDLLEDLGCRWYWPGDLGERIPKQTSVSLPVGIKDEEPSLRGRGLILGHDRYLEDAEAWIDWASKNRFNYIFFYFFPPHRLGGRPERIWRKRMKGAAEAIRRRGMAIHYGGPLWSYLLPRRMIWRWPQAFRFDGKRRTANHNLCPSSPIALQIVRQRARKFFRTHKEVDVFHIWPDDLPADGSRMPWCLCPACEHLSASDQVLTVTNEIADVLAEEIPRAICSFPAHHDTRKAPVSVKPRPNVVLLYDSRERCYAHVIDDEQCARNQSYTAALISQITWFQDAGWPVHQILEHYLDGMLFKGMSPPLGHLLAQDLAAYRKLGCEHVGVTVTGCRPWIAAPINGYLFAKLSWDVGLDPNALYRDYAAGYFGGPEETFTAYLQELEAAFRLVLELDLEAEDIAGGTKTLPRDTLGYFAVPLPTTRAYWASLVQARRHLERATAHLETASQPGVGWKPRGRITRQEVLSREHKVFELCHLELDFLYQRQLAYCLAAEGASRREVSAAVGEARTLLAQIARWAARELRQERFWLRQFHHLLSVWRLHLAHVRRRGAA